MAENNLPQTGHMQQLSQTQNLGQGQSRFSAQFFGERNQIGKRRSNIGGVGGGGALQSRRLAGSVSTTIVGA